MDIFTIYRQHANQEKAVKMAAYMKDHFPFLGIQKPERVKISKVFLRSKKKEAEIDWAFITDCYNQKEREFHYLAIDYLMDNKSKLTEDDFFFVENLINQHAWWDSTDALNNVVAYMYKQYPNVKHTIASWIDSKSIWQKRISIIVQLKFKLKTDTDFLQKAILHNAESKEFFINKAIGWALREYSKTNPEWVRIFIRQHTLTPLSIREASKYI